MKIILWISSALVLTSCAFSGGLMKPTPLPRTMNPITKIGFYETGDTVFYCMREGFFVEAKILGFYSLNKAMVRIKNGQNTKIYTSQIKYSKSKSRRSGIRFGQIVTFKHQEIFSSINETGQVIGIAPFKALIKVNRHEFEVAYEDILK